MQGRYRKNFYVRSSETPHCPHCDSTMIVSGSRKRILQGSDGQQSVLIIRRLKCQHCQRIHHELPDIIVPYKRYSADAIEEILDERKEETYPCEDSTALRLRCWFSLLRDYFEKALCAIRYRHRQDEEVWQELSNLIPLTPITLSAGWLKSIVRILVNSGFWLQTRFA